MGRNVHVTGCESETERQYDHRFKIVADPLIDGEPVRGKKAVQRRLRRAGQPDETDDSAHGIGSVHVLAGVFLRTAASTKARKRGCGATGRDLNSG